MFDLKETPLPESMAQGEWAIVEIMGHSTIIGRVAEVQRYGTSFLQVEPLFNGELLEPVLQGGSSIYRMTPCSAEVAWRRQATSDYQLPSSVRARLAQPALPAPERATWADGTPLDDDDDRDPAEPEFHEVAG